MEWQEILEKLFSVSSTIFQIIYWYLEAFYHLIVPPPMQSIENEVILVTGACGGIGSEICKSLVRSATTFKLVICDLKLTDLENLSKILKSINSSVQVFPYEVDISSQDNVDKFCQNIKKNVGSVTILFNNAGIYKIGNFLQFSDEQINKIYQVNLMSHIWLIRKVLPDMVLGNHGRIINICSMGGLKASTCGFPYFSSKFAVNGYTESLKLELMLFQNTGIHVTTVYPYFVQTPIVGSLKIEDNGGQITQIPKSFRKFQNPVEVGKKIVEGMRRQYEFIYLPWSLPLILLSEYFVPMKLRKLLAADYFKNLQYQDEKDYKQIESFVETIKK